MFPIIAIAGAISAASFGHQRSGLARRPARAPPKPLGRRQDGGKARTEIKVSQFEAALAAQAAGQSVPGNGADAVRRRIRRHSHGPAGQRNRLRQPRQDAGGLAVYGHVGERHDEDTREQPSGPGESAPITRSWTSCLAAECARWPSAG